MPILPNREELRVEYDAAIQELLSKELTNHNLDKGWYSQIGGSLFDACYRALEDACHPEAQVSPRDALWCLEVRSYACRQRTCRKWQDLIQPCFHRRND